MRMLPAAVLVALVALAGCGATHAKAPTSTTYTDSAHGITVALPDGWQRATTSLTPHLTDPREELSVGTFPLRYRDTGCAHMPTSAIEDMRPGDALVTLMERGVAPASAWSDFIPRPAHFGPSLGFPSEAAACAPGAHVTDRLINFTAGDRHFNALVVFGADASAATKREAWQILDGLKIDPNARPDWRASP